MAHKLLIVGGNGFVGSAVCRAALGRGWEVTSMSSSGKPFRTPKGHAPAWTSKVSWHAASALHPDSYHALIRDKTAVVHTVGTLLETTQYKEALRNSDLRGLAKSVFGGGHGNPLTRGASHPASYETLNRDTALRVCEEFVSAVQGAPSFAPELRPFPFVYLSAEDMGRPFIPHRYIETKRQAEHGISQLCAGTNVRGVYMRPSFVYHPHLRPITSVIAALASLSATIHEKSPSFFPTPSRVLRALSSPSPPETLPSALNSMADTLELAPIHLDHVGDAVCKAIERQDVMGPVSVQNMRHLIGWGAPEEHFAAK